MPYRITWEPRGVYRTYFGNVTIDERRQSFDEICTDPRFDALRFSITDYLAVQQYEVQSEATEEIAALHVPASFTNPNILIAAVVDQPPIIEAIRHFMALRMARYHYEMFATVAQARHWIATHPHQPNV